MIYLASPYSDPSPEVREQRFKAVCKVAACYMSRGELIFSPIAHSHPIALSVGYLHLPTGYDYWGKWNRAMLTTCSKFWVLTLPGWEKSVGVTAERKIAKELGLRTHFISPLDVDLESQPW